MAVNRRPIVYYEALKRRKYDQQVAEIMTAKTEYILFASPADDTIPVPVKVEQLEPKVQPIQLNPRTQQRSTQAPVASVTHPAKTDADKTKKATPKPNHVDNMTGLGLSLDSIFGEEAQVAQKNESNYFKDSK